MNKCFEFCVNYVTLSNFLNKFHPHYMSKSHIEAEKICILEDFISSKTMCYFIFLFKLVSAILIWSM